MINTIANKEKLTQNNILHRLLAVELTEDQLEQVSGGQTGRYYWTASCDRTDADYGRDND